MVESVFFFPFSLLIFHSLYFFSLSSVQCDVLNTNIFLSVCHLLKLWKPFLHTVTFMRTLTSQVSPWNMATQLSLRLKLMLVKKLIYTVEVWKPVWLRTELELIIWSSTAKMANRSQLLWKCRLTHEIYGKCSLMVGM